MKRTILFLSAILLTAMFGSCITIARHSYEKTGNVIDHSFETTGSVIESGYLTYVFPRQEKLKPRNGINISGNIRRLDDSPRKVMAKWVHPNEDETIFIGPWYVVYQWDGAFTFDGKTEQAEMFLHAYSGGEEGRGKLLEYSGDPSFPRIGDEGFSHTTDANKEYMELRTLVSRDIIRNFPFPLGTFMAEKNTYKLYLTKEAEYVLVNDSKMSDEEIERRTGIFDQNENDLARLFYRQGQKFQAVDDSGAVVAEICDDSYTLYDTLPKEDLPAVKRDIAWFYTYRSLTRYLDSFLGGWDIPLFR
ncbi:MAG: hypothetical protein LBF60_00545 [Treponema sp.]|jgi:hypothetical protein|nr:hypothetical protein [Treponema sp.]